MRLFFYYFYGGGLWDKLDGPKPISPQIGDTKNTQLESNRVELKRGVYSDLTLQPMASTKRRTNSIITRSFEGINSL